MKLQKTMSDQKLRGGYYTPKIIRNFLVNWAVDSTTKSILEPSCGDGGFFETVFEGEYKKIKEVVGIELNPEEAKKAEKIVSKFGKNSTIVNDDFFKYYVTTLEKKKFDVILGNPPFIRYQYFDEEQQNAAQQAMLSAGIKIDKLTNIWAPFLIASVTCLNEGGRLAMVIPGEIMHVNYSSKIRLFLSELQAKITLITFNQLVFPDVQQEVILLLIDKQKKPEKIENFTNSKINIIQLKDVESLNFFDLNSIQLNQYKNVNPTEEKWTKFFLTKEQLKELVIIEKNSLVRKLGDLATVDVGIVTGANKYFVVNEDILKQYELENISLPLVGRSLHINGLIFEKKDWNENKKKQIASHLLNFPDKKYENYSELMKKYIEMGEKNNIHEGYKTGIRNRWYQVPSIWKPDAFLMRRSHKFPKLVLNNADSFTTDTMHRVKIKEDVDLQSLIFCFYNSITMASCEIIGRSHGGGVLEILPNDAETILIPYKKIASKHLQKIDSMFRKDREIDPILDYVDDILLKDHLNLSSKSISEFRTIQKTLTKRRLSRKQSKKS
ncbi:MAG: hypothetical protein CXT78_09240 [Thaumarchaeota archaeon]|jgi:adenine-specific DNA-methyltransferase|nr:MAG: hypothetical protein CXT78_09240 [Nitrososphaerota archaeon]